MNDNQQTAVETLWNLIPKDTQNYIVKQFNGLEKAKEMEKERLINAFDEGQEYEYQYHINSTPKFDSETWYNETYGGNK